VIRILKDNAFNATNLKVKKYHFMANAIAFWAQFGLRAIRNALQFLLTIVRKSGGKFVGSAKKIIPCPMI